MTYASLCQAVATMRADNPKDTYGKKRKRSTLEFQAMYEQLLTEHLLSSS